MPFSTRGRTSDWTPDDSLTQLAFMRTTYENLLAHGTAEDVELARVGLENVTRLEADALRIGHNMAVSAEADRLHNAAGATLRRASALVVVTFTVVTFTVVTFAIAAIISPLVVPTRQRTAALIAACIGALLLFTVGRLIGASERIVARAGAEVAASRAARAQRIPRSD